jgi:hypothetical protein
MLVLYRNMLRQVGAFTDFFLTSVGNLKVKLNRGKVGNCFHQRAG